MWEVGRGREEEEEGGGGGEEVGDWWGAGREDKTRGQDDTLLLCCFMKTVSCLMGEGVCHGHIKTSESSSLLLWNCK